MRLREIKPEMVVECKTDEELKILLEEAERLGYLWTGGKNPTEEINKGRTIHFYDKCEYEEYKHITWSDNKGNIEFSDLIIPELSAEEVLRICHEICIGKDCARCEMGKNCFAGDEPDFKKVVEICEQWKANHEKKEPELEWVNVIRVKCGDDLVYEKWCDDVPDEEVQIEAEDILKMYLGGHEGNYIALVERMCRVKKII